MSVEQLLDKGESAAIIDGERRRVEVMSGVRSFVHIVASAYIRQATDAIKSISRNYEKPHEAAASQEDFMERLTQKDRGAVLINHAGLVMGICLHIIENSLVERVVVAANIAAEYNMAISGTPFETAMSGEGAVEQIPDDKWHMMIDCVGKDPTFGTFFTEGFDILPEIVKQNLLGSGVQGVIAQRIIPTYCEQVRTLIAKNGSGS